MVTRNIILCFIVIICLTACSKDDSIKQEVEELEQLAQQLKEKREGLEYDNADQNKENERTQAAIEELIRTYGKDALKSMWFLIADNPMQLTNDVRCEIIGDSIVECWIPNIMSNKVLVPRFVYEGKKIDFDGKSATSGVTPVDFTRPTDILITTAFNTRSYKAYVHAFTGIPVLWIETADRENLAEDNRYRSATLRLVEDCRTRAAGDIIEADIQIRHEGEFATYFPNFDGKEHTGKNAYSFEFYKKISLLDEAESYGWELWPNNNDITMLRQQAAFHISKLSRIEPTSGFHFVELILNGRFYGTYLLGAKKNSSDISESIKAAEAVLFSENFTDKESGWQKYLDNTSLADWFIVNEILMNKDGASNPTDFLTLNDKLTVGPLWQIDDLLGLKSSKTTGLVLKDSKWFGRLLQDPAFVAEVKERYIYFYKQRENILKEIEADAEYLKYSIVENSNRWAIFGDISSTRINQKYQEEVANLIEWMKERMDCLNNEINNL